jgi:dienelactone hydrolase
VSQTTYMVQQYLQGRFETVGRRLAFRAESVDEWAKWRETAVARLEGLIGYDTMERCPLNATITEEIELDDHVRQRVEIETEPDVIMPFYVLIPAGGNAPYKAVLAPHGHGSGGKYAPAGRRDMPDIVGTIEQHNYDYGVQFVRAGFIVFCPDARGFGERQEAASKSGGILQSSCGSINNMAIPLGQTVTGMWAWDLRRLIDYAEERSDTDTDDGVGCAGLSGGGLQTLWAAAMDTRIRCAVVSGYLYGYKESLLDKHQNCSCNYVPHLYEYVDMGDIAALIAPRPLLVETGDKDTLNGASGLGNVTPQVEIARNAYGLLGADGLIAHDIFDGEHRWNGVEAIPWMETHMAGDGTTSSET